MKYILLALSLLAVSCSDKEEQKASEIEEARKEMFERSEKSIESTIEAAKKSSKY